MWLYKLKRGEYMYEILKEYTYDDILNFTFYKKVIFDYDSEERYFCLTVQNHDCGTDENVLLDFIYDSDEFDDKAETTVREYLLNNIASNIECIAYDLGLKKLKIISGEFGVVVGEKYFQLNDNDDYEKLESDTTNYVKSLAAEQNIK